LTGFDTEINLHFIHGDHALSESYGLTVSRWLLMNNNALTSVLSAADEPAKHHSAILRNPYVAMRKQIRNPHKPSQ
jgi:hypothetical protein